MTDGWSFLSQSEAETDKLGLRVAKALDTGIVVALNGQLGSGKTRFVRALCAGLGINTDHVNSPTFVIQQLYTDGRIPVAHFDTYRLADVDEFLSIGADEFLNSDEWLCLIEWAERIQEILPRDHLTITIRQTAATSRQFRFTSHGPNSDAVLDRLRATRLA
jgi:tRNA threonylcarbamoyladenosine biosynthesis protein TsaE